MWDFPIILTQGGLIIKRKRYKGPAPAGFLIFSEHPLLAGDCLPPRFYECLL